MSKSSTERIVLIEPDKDQLENALDGRSVTPGLAEFLKNLLERKKWARKINIPSDHDDVAAVLVFSTILKKSGLEILSELHVFFGGKIMVEKWQVMGELEPTSLLPKEAFRAIDISTVHVEGAVVKVEFSVPLNGGDSSTLTKTFDFTAENVEVRIVPHPLLELPAFGAKDQAALSTSKSGADT
jgi:hypothetical protein